MVLSYYLLKYPYRAAWRLARVFSPGPVVLYCAGLLDYEIFAPVHKHLKKIDVVVPNRKVLSCFRKAGIDAKLYPAFPRGVIMCRQATYRFPEPSIVKIGMRHGAYHFKPFANPKGYNMFDSFLMTSSTEVQRSFESGIRVGVPVGFPKLDAAFDGTYSASALEAVSASLSLDATKPTILFTATWDKSGVSAIDRWCDKLDELTAAYNLLVTVHPWTSERYKTLLGQQAGVRFIETANVLPCILLADVCVGDTSSILAECCALDKPLITFRVPNHRRTVDEIIQMLERISLRIDNFEEIRDAIEESLRNPGRMSQERAAANELMFDKLDGLAGLRAAKEIVRYFPELANF